MEKEIRESWGEMCNFIVIASDNPSTDSKVTRPQDAAFLIIAAGGILELLGNGKTQRDWGEFISAYY